MSFATPYGPPISLRQADAAVQGAMAEAEKRGWSMDIALVDSGANRPLITRRTLMNTFDEILTRNLQFAQEHAGSPPVSPTLPDALRSVKALVLGCADMRVDPAHVLGFEQGEAVVMRNVGGRVTPGLLRQFGLLGRIGEVAGVAPGEGKEFHLIVLQHTDCGILRLKDDPAQLADYFEVNEEALPEKSVTDPREALRSDVAVLRSIEGLPGSWILSGLVYDVHSGRVEVVVPPAPLHA